MHQFCNKCGYYTGLDKHIFEHKIVNSFLPIILAYALDVQKNRLIETVLVSTQHMFWLRNKKCYALLYIRMDKFCNMCGDSQVLTVHRTLFNF